MPQPASPSITRFLLLGLGVAALGLAGFVGLRAILPARVQQSASEGVQQGANSPAGSGQGSTGEVVGAGLPSSASPSGRGGERFPAIGDSTSPGVPSSSTPESIAKDPMQLLAVNQLGSVTSDEQFRRLVDDANMAAAKGGDEQERRDIAQLIESKSYSAAASALLAIAERPGGVTTFTDTDLPKALRKEGRIQEAEALEAEIGVRTLATLERMEELALGQAAPVVFDITFWRANQYLRRGTPEWRRAFECLERVGASIPAESTARNAGYVRSLGLWARQTIDRVDEEARRPR